MAAPFVGGVSRRRRDRGDSTGHLQSARRAQPWSVEAKSPARASPPARYDQGEMTERGPQGPQQQDMPWNDSPADSEAPPGSEEPDPAEVLEGDDGEAVDSTDNPQLEADFYHRDSLDERLAGEGPEASLRPQARAGRARFAADFASRRSHR